MNKEVDWGSVIVDGSMDDGFYAAEGCWDDGTEMTDKELDDLDSATLYDMGYDRLVMSAEAAFEGDR